MYLKIITLLMAISVTRCDSSLRKQFSTLLFGPLWTYEQFCGDQRNYSTILEDDLEAQLFYNKSTSDSLRQTSQQTTTPTSLASYDLLNLQGIKAKSLLTSICSVASWNYADQKVFELSNKPFDNERECLNQLDQFYNTFKSQIEGGGKSRKINDNAQAAAAGKKTNLFDHWLQLNTFGRVPEGLIYSDHRWLGDFDECLKLNSTRYCFGAYKSINWPEGVRPNINAFRIGLCLPRACNDRLSNNSNYIKKLQSLIEFNSINRNFGLDDNNNNKLYKLIEIHCPPAEDSLQRKVFNDFGSILMLIIAICWLLMLIYGSSTSNNSCDKSSSSSIKEMFDVRRNFRNFMKSEHLVSELIGLNAVKVITMNLIITSHLILVLKNNYKNSIEFRDAWDVSIIGTILTQGQHLVQLFFMISGLIVGYKYLNKNQAINSIKELNLLDFIWQRYTRLMPMYFIIYAFIKKFGHLLGSGPLWDYGVSAQSEHRQCQLESWLVPILMLANFIGPAQHCVITGWHLANDFQIYTILPILFYAFKQSRLKGYLLVLSVYVFSYLYTIYQFAFATYGFIQFSEEALIFGSPVVLGRGAYSYVTPLIRIRSYFVGVILADVLFINPILPQIKERYLQPSPPEAATTTTINQRTQVKLASLNGSLVVGTRKKREENPLKEEEEEEEQQQQQQQPTQSLSTIKIKTKTSKVIPKTRTPPSSSPPPPAEPGSRVNQLREYLFKDNNLLTITAIAGISLLLFILVSPVFPAEIRDMFKPNGKSLGYPSLMLLSELACFLILFSLVAGQEDTKLVEQQRTTANNNHNHNSDEQVVDDNNNTNNNNHCERQYQQIRDDNRIVASSNNSKRMVIDFLQSTIWNLLVKLNYCYMLTHWAVFRYLIQTSRHLLIYSWTNLIQQLVYSFSACYLLSFILCLSIEMPLTLLIKRLVLFLSDLKIRRSQVKVRANA